MKRKRITITVKKDLLDQIDDKIDGANLRNRSHAIEYYLNQSLGSKINKVLILAGGNGLRMRPYTYEIPKCMISVDDKPILEHTINLLKKYKITDIYLAVDYLSHKIKKYFEDGKKLGVKITYINNRKPLGTGGALKQAKRYLTDEKFLLIHGDLLADINLVDMVNFSIEQNKLVTLAVTTAEDPSLYGSLKLNGNQVVQYDEKPSKKYSVSRTINAGIYVINRQFFDFMPSKKAFSLENDVLRKLIEQNKVAAYHFAGFWFDISTPTNYSRALIALKNLDKKTNI